MDKDDSKDGSNAAAGEEEEAVDPLEEHEKRLQLARQNQEKGEPDKTEAKNWFSNQSSSCTDHSPRLFCRKSLMLLALSVEKWRCA